MKKNRKVWIFVTVFSFFSALSTRAQKQDLYFTSPVHFTIYLSSNFGEIRPDHFHSGIDIKTNGRTGEKIYAIAQGYISRIKVAVSGFGHAIYITHPNGYTSVYAHLSRFTDDVAAYVRDEQYKQKSFTVDVFPPAGLFRISKGQLIGLSGNTGNSFGPHLHFEIRETRKEAPVNPLKFGFPVKDTIAPKIYRLYLYPENHTTLINNKYKKQIFRPLLTGYHQYTLRDSLIRITGPFSLGLEAQDYMNGSHSRCGIYSFDVRIDQQRFFYYTMDEFTYGETRYINSYIDYREKVKNDRNVIRTVILPNNRLDIYRKVINKGIVDLPDEKLHRIDFIISDIHGNTSDLHFYVVRTEKPVTLTTLPEENNYLSVMSWDRDNYYSFDGFRVFIPRGALYDTLAFTMNIKAALPYSFSPRYSIQDPYTPLQKKYTVWITPDYLPKGDPKKLLIAEVSQPSHPKPAGGEWTGKAVRGDLSRFGTYTLLIDTIPPRITPVFDASLKNFQSLRFIRFTIGDNLSGIDSYNGYIDGKWVLFEYEPKRKMLTYRFDKKRLNAQQQHHLRLVVTDKRNNTTTWEKDFYW